ncbi:MAG: M20/M25/M40 family metallo-hydrolase [Fidelibacterota bacterium]
MEQTAMNRLIELFLELVKIDALSKQEAPVNHYIQAFLNELNLSASEDRAGVSSNGNSGNLQVRIGNGGNFVILSHMDTARSTKNIKPIVTDDRITSDGTTILGADNRAGIATILFCLEKAFTNNVPIKDFTIAFTIREELDVFGSQFLVLPEQIKHGFVFDSSLRPGKFINKTYGAKGFTTKIHGKASHAGIHPENGISAIQVAAKAIATMKLGRVDHETTANIGKFNGGTAINVIPELVELEGEVRSLKIPKVDRKIKEIKDVFIKQASAENATVEFESHWDFKPYEVPESSFTFQRITNALLAVGLKPEPIVSAGGSDANSLNEKGIITINIGIGAQNPHANNEFILVEDLINSARILWELIKK